MVRRLSFLILAVVVLLALTAGVAAAGTDLTTKASIKVIVLLKQGGNGKEVGARLAARDAKSVYRYHIIPAYSATVSQATIDALRADPNVLRVVNDRRVRVPKVPASGSESLSAAAKKAAAAKAATADAPLESEALQLTHAQDAWNIKVNGQYVTGQGIKVGILDTGTDPYHPDLAAAIGGYKDFTGEGLYDNVGHGTATSSTVAAQGLPVYNYETGTTMKVSGMAPGAKVYMAKVAGEYDGWDSQSIRGIQWLVDNDVDIISCSLGWLFFPEDGKDPGAMAMQAAVDQGVTVVNSEGNEGPGQGTMGSAPDAPGLIAVGASTGNRMFSQEGFMVDGDAYKGDQVITWSSRGPNSDGIFRPDILGFGAYGWALLPSYGCDYGINMIAFGGTSMAAPVVAGDLALAQCAWKLAHPGKALPKPAYWKKLLASTATDLGYPALDQSTGLVNAQAAVKAVLKRGKSMLVTVAADGRTPCSWSPRVAEGAKKTTTITLKNTGNAKETIKLSPTVFVADSDETITRTVTLKGPAYEDYEDIVVPGGTEFVQTTVTWPSGPEVSIRSALYDSDGNFLTYAPTYGGYGHLSQCQVSLKGPKDQRPVVGSTPWTLAIFPRASMMPTSDQTVNIKIEFLHKANWGRLSLSRTKVTLGKGRSYGVKATVKVPNDYGAGTYFGGIRVSNGSTVTTVPVSLHVPVTMIEGDFGIFQGKLTGSDIEYFGGEFYFYDFTVPDGATSLDAQLTWPDQGNLINLYLVDPDGRVRDAKGGDLNYSDYSDVPWVPDSALTRTAEQVIWADPQPGRWHLIVWGAGFSGNGFSEPFRGVVALDGAWVAPTAWTATGAPGDVLTKDFTVSNDGPTELNAYAGSTLTIAGQAWYNPVWWVPFTGALPAKGPAGADGAIFWLPQNVQQLTAYVNWKSTESQLVDVGLYDPTGTDVAESIATTDEGNAVQVQNPVAGLWSAVLAYADPDVPPVPLGWEMSIMTVEAAPIDGFKAPGWGDPVTVAADGEGTVTATIAIPKDATPGDTITGTVDFYTADDQATVIGGDHLGSVPVTITVAPL